MHYNIGAELVILTPARNPSRHPQTRMATVLSKSIRAALGACLLAVAASAASAQGKAYSLDDLVGLLKRKVSSTRLLTLAKQNCITFSVTGDAESAIRRAGGSTDLVNGLHDVCGPDHPKVAVDTAKRVAPGAVPIPVAAAPVDTMVPVHIRAAVVNPDLSIRSLPQLDMLIITPKGDTLHVSTDLEGKFERQFKTGVYRIESTAEVGTSRYKWAFFATFAADMQPIELTQKNATIESTATPAGVAAAAAGAVPRDTVVKVVAAPPPPKPLTEREIFERDRASLYSVFGYSARGSGFLVDSSGLVLTTNHLVEYADELRVQVDSVTKVYARVVARDRDKDIAVLAINPKRCGKCRALTFADSAHGGTPGPGDRVLAFGSPLNKLGVLSLGIISAADGGSIVSDVSVGWQNSGGPLVSKDGFVIGLTDDKGNSDAGGGRTQTSVAAPLLVPVVAKGRDSIPALAAKPVSDELLPIAPREPFPAEPIAAVAKLGEDFNLKNYRADEGPFYLFMMTPQIMAWRQQQAVNALAAKKQDDPKRYATFSKIDPIQGWLDWDEFLADRKAVVVFNIMPNDAEFPFYNPDKIQSFSEGSFRDMRILRDGVAIVPVEKVSIPGVLNVAQMKAAGKQIPNQGIYVYRVNDFAPRAVGTVATYTVVITDGMTGRQYKITLDGKMIEQMWKDFTPYQYGRQ